MKRINRLQIVTAALFVALAFVGALPEAEAGPAAQVAEKTYDFGSIQEGSQVSHDFLIQNRGCCVLLIQRMDADAGCTITSDEMQIKPGQSGKATMTFTTVSNGDKPVVKKAFITTNDPRTRTLVLTMQGMVAQAINK